MEFLHQLTLTELNLDYNKLPKSIKGSINNFKQRQAKLTVNGKIDAAGMQKLKTLSAVIADELITHYEAMPDRPRATTGATHTNDETEQEIEERMNKYRSRRKKIV